MEDASRTYYNADLSVLRFDKIEEATETRIGTPTLLNVTKSLTTDELADDSLQTTVPEKIVEKNKIMNKP